MRQTAASVVFVALLAAPALTGDLEQIKQSGVLRALVAAHEQPAAFNATGDGPPGLERELLEGFTRLHRLELVPVSVPLYKDRIPALLAGRGDVVVGIIDTPARREKIAFTVETYPTRCVVLTLEPHRIVETVEQLQEEKVGILEGTTTWLSAAVGAGVPDPEIRRFSSLDAVFEAMGTGEITATVMSAFDMGFARRKNPGLQPGVVVGAHRSAAWGIRKSDTDLRDALSEYISRVRRTPTWSRLVVKYFGAEALLVLGRQ